jgi:predicted transposase YbfD/YdcC
MEDPSTDCGALSEAVVFLHHFSDLPDPRQRGKVMYPLDEILLLALLAVLGGADSFVEIARFGCKKRELLRRFRKRHGWPGLNAIAMVESTRETGGAIERDTRYYITSLVMMAHLLGPVIRSHWAIENSLHWVMDMIFRDDESRVRTNHAPANFTTIKHMACNLLRRPSSKDSLRVRRKVAAWDDEFLASLVTG